MIERFPGQSEELKKLSTINDVIDEMRSVTEGWKKDIEDGKNEGMLRKMEKNIAESLEKIEISSEEIEKFKQIVGEFISYADDMEVVKKVKEKFALEIIDHEDLSL